MADIKDGGPAFPGVETPAGGIPGMTLRDYFAAKAMQATCTYIGLSQEDVATVAYAMADAMLKAREAK